MMDTLDSHQKKDREESLVLLDLLVGPIKKICYEIKTWVQIF